MKARIYLLFGRNAHLAHTTIYPLAVTGVRAFGALTPIGGVAFILAWVMFAVAVMKNR